MKLYIDIFWGENSWEREIRKYGEILILIGQKCMVTEIKWDYHKIEFMQCNIGRKNGCDLHELLLLFTHIDLSNITSCQFRSTLYKLLHFR